MGLEAVGANTHHPVALACKQIQVVSEVTGLGGAAGGVVLGVEVEYDLATEEVLQAELTFLTLLVYTFEAEVRSLVPFLQHPYPPWEVYH